MLLGAHVWKIAWTEELGGLQSMGSQRIKHDWATKLAASHCGAAPSPPTCMFTWLVGSHQLLPEPPSDWVLSGSWLLLDFFPDVASGNASMSCKTWCSVLSSSCEARVSILPEFTLEPPVLDQLLLLQEVLSQLNPGFCLSSLVPSPASPHAPHLAQGTLFTEIPVFDSLDSGSYPEQMWVGPRLLDRESWQASFLSRMELIFFILSGLFMAHVSFPSSPCPGLDPPVHPPWVSGMLFWRALLFISSVTQSPKPLWVLKKQKHLLLVPVLYIWPTCSLQLQGQALPSRMGWKGN